MKRGGVWGKFRNNGQYRERATGRSGQHQVLKDRLRMAGEKKCGASNLGGSGTTKDGCKGRNWGSGVEDRCSQGV